MLGRGGEEVLCEAEVLLQLVFGVVALDLEQGSLLSVGLGFDALHAREVGVGLVDVFVFLRFQSLDLLLLDICQALLLVLRQELVLVMLR